MTVPVMRLARLIYMAERRGDELQRREPDQRAWYQLSDAERRQYISTAAELVDLIEAES